VRFAKYHGLGNDFVVVDLRAAEPAIAAAIQEPNVVKAVCDRQFGVGADGVLAILPAPGADARMRVLNADGSEAEMCGNGIRCVVEELHAHGGLAKDDMAIETGAGKLICQRRDGGVTVAMGAPRLTRGEIPMTGPASERCVDQPIEIIGHPTRHVTCVSMGNPHAVIFIDSNADLRDLAETIGPRIEHHAWFPARTNVEIVRVRSRGELDVVVWERGVGRTLACGTGACATAVVALEKGLVRGPSVRVSLPGGDLEIEPSKDGHTFMTGPARRVFEGETSDEDEP